MGYQPIGDHLRERRLADRRYRERLSCERRARIQKENNPVLGRLEELKQRANAALAAAKREESRLYDHELGVALYDWETHERLLGEIKARRNARLNEIRSEAERISEEGRRQVDLLQNFPRESVLNAVERSELGDRLPLIGSEFEGASPKQIAARLEAINEHGSKAEKYAVWLAAKERLRELEERGREFASIAFAKQYGDLDATLFEEKWKRRTAPYVEQVNAAENLATACFVAIKDAASLATAHATYANAEHVECQMYDHGGRVEVSPPGVQATEGQIANG